MNTLYELRINGEFQTGYKRFIKQVADELNVKGSIKNINQKEVQIIFQAETNTLKEVFQKILVENSKSNIYNHSIHSVAADKKLDAFKIYPNNHKPGFWNQLKNWMSQK